MNDNFYFALSYLANLCQLADFKMNISQLSNDDLMKHLIQQDKVLDEQTNIYLKEIVQQNKIIIKQNKEILKLLNKNNIDNSNII